MAKKLVQYDVIAADQIGKMTEGMMRSESAFGTRCPQYEPTCANCIAWHIWDLERELSGLKARWDNP